MACVGHRDRAGILGELIARKQGRRLRLDDARFQPEICGQRGIEHHELRVRHGRRIDPRVESARQRAITMLEP